MSPGVVCLYWQEAGCASRQAGCSMAGSWLSLSRFFPFALIFLLLNGHWLFEAAAV